MSDKEWEDGNEGIKYDNTGTGERREADVCNGKNGNKVEGQSEGKFRYAGNKTKDKGIGTSLDELSFLGEFMSEGTRNKKFAAGALAKIKTKSGSTKGEEDSNENPE